ncbi:unnamed protein product [Rotaria sp. Silwood2]|nr:unnamed protein product [Rotaria sp. Silwood2]
MFIKLLFIYISTLLPIVYSLCYTNISETWICDGYDTLNTTTTANSDYEIILNNQQFKNFFLKNYYLSIFIIDNYPLTLHLLNASGYPPFTISDFLSNIWIYLMRANPCHLLNTIKHFVKNKLIFTDSYQRASSYKQISRII